MDRHLRAPGTNVDREHGALHERDQVGRADSEMRSGFLLDAEERAAVILDDLDQPARFGLGRQAQAALRRHDDIFLPPHEHGAGARSGGDDVARGEKIAAPGGGEPAAMLDLDGSGRFRDSPGWSVRGHGRSAPEHRSGDDKQPAHNHDDSLQARAQFARRVAAAYAGEVESG
jgi:hypothetical protein